jgi:3-hydroxyacyl-[acyl-carrier-protein] dehydratase
MPPRLVFDIAGIDLNHVMFGVEEIQKVNPQRGDMHHLDAVVWADGPAGKILGYKDVRENEFWVPGHIPGRPLLPGVIMIEAAAQLASFYTKTYLGWTSFVGFGGVEACKFRQPVSPGVRLHLLALKIWERHSRVCCNTQGLVNGQVVFEAQIVGTEL